MAEVPRQIKQLPLVEHPEILETFIDSISLAIFDGGTLRLEMAVTRFEEPKPPNTPAGKRHVACRLVLSTPATVELINQMQQISAALTKAGVLKQSPPQTTEPPKSN